LIDRALMLNPNLATAWLFSGWARVWLGEPELALEHLARAMRLSPQDPQFFNMRAAAAAAYFFAGRYAEALPWADSAAREQPNYLLAASTAAAANALAGRHLEAQKAMTRIRLLDPNLRISNLKYLFPIQRPDHFAKWEEALRKAGLPE